MDELDLHTGRTNMFYSLEAEGEDWDPVKLDYLIISRSVELYHGQ